MFNITSTNIIVPCIYILLKETMTIISAGADETARDVDERNKQVISKNCAPFTNCINEIDNTQIDNAKGINVLMPMYKLIKYSYNYSKTSRSLWKC